MIGVVLAGGQGTRFHPVTKAVNKHLLDVFDRPMIHFPLLALAGAGIQDVVLVAGDHLDRFQALLGDGAELGIHLRYAHQEQPHGIGDALAMASPYIEDDRLVVILGDNIFFEGLSPYVERFRAQGVGARVLLKRVEPSIASSMGVAVIEDGTLVRIEEKPAEPPSDLAVTGCYMYDNTVFGIIEELDPSARGELEISDVNNVYVRKGQMHYDVLEGEWIDAGTPIQKLRAALLIARSRGVETAELL